MVFNLHKLADLPMRGEDIECRFGWAQVLRTLAKGMGLFTTQRNEIIEM